MLRRIVIFIFFLFQVATIYHLLRPSIAVVSVLLKPSKRKRKAATPDKRMNCASFVEIERPAIITMRSLARVAKVNPGRIYYV